MAILFIKVVVIDVKLPKKVIVAIEKEHRIYCFALDKLRYNVDIYYSHGSLLLFG